MIGPVVLGAVVLGAVVSRSGGDESLVGTVVSLLVWSALVPRGAPWAVRGRPELTTGTRGTGAVRASERVRRPRVRRSRAGRRAEHRGRSATGVHTDDVPRTADMLAVAVAAGCPISQAVADVAVVLRTSGGASPMVAAGDAMERGADLAPVLDAMALAGGGWHSLATQLSLSADSGVPSGPALRRLAAQERLRLRRERERRARRLPVLLLVPLTTMVLPAFMLVTVVPFVAAGGISLDLPHEAQLPRDTQLPPGERTETGNDD